MTIANVKRNAFAMPLSNPAIPPGAVPSCEPRVTLGMGGVIHDHLA